MFQVHSQHLDLASGFHVIELRDGELKHLVQIAVGHESCLACGHVHPKNDLGEIDPKALAAQVIQSLNESHANMLDYAKRHNLKVK